MWLSRLDLLAFGKFTNVRLELGPGFHLVVGPNEAGKSTALRAIRQLLFGFDERTPDNFLHANPNLRIGGVVCCGTDLELKVIRRKSRKDSLRGEDDMTVIAPDQWDPLLGGVDEATFCLRYGIDYEQLIEGGHQIATGNGDLGEILFATGSGVMDLKKVKQSLTAEAEEIFKPLGKKARLNQLLLKWQELKDKVRDKLLSVTVWEETDRLRQDAISRLKQVTTELTRLTGEFDQLQLLQQARPIVLEIDALEKDLAPIRSAPRLQPGFATQRQEAFLLLRQASLYQTAATEAIQRAQKELEKLELPRELITHADEISQCINERGSCEKGLHDRAVLIEQCHRHSTAIDELVTSLGQSVPPVVPTSIDLDRTKTSRLGPLGRLYAGFTQSLEDATSHHERVTRQIEEAQTLLATIPPSRPLQDFRAQLRTVQSDGDLEARLQEACNELSALRESVNQHIDALGIGPRSIEEVTRIRIPDQEKLKKFETDFHANQAERLLWESRISELAIEHNELEKKIEHLRQEFQVPTEADLTSSRLERTQLWTKIRRVWQSKLHPSEQDIDAFEKSMSQVDQISDRLRLEADRVAQLAEELADREANETRQHEASIRLAQLDADRILLETKWHSEWPDLKELAPLPTEVKAWLMRHEVLVRNQELALRRQNDANLLKARIQTNVTTLSRLLGIETSASAASTGSSTGAAARHREIARQKQLSFGWEPDNGIDHSDTDTSRLLPSATLPLTELVRRAEERLMQEEAALQQRRETVERIADLHREQAEFAAVAVKARNELSQWNSRWQAALSEIGLPSDSTPDVAEAFIQTLNQLSNHQVQRKQLQERIAGIDMDLQRLQTRVRAVCLNVAPDLVEQDVLDAVYGLQNRLLAVQREESIRNEQTARKSQAEVQRIQAQDTRTRGERILASLCQEANVARTGEATSNVSENEFNELLKELESVENQAHHRDALEQKLERARVRLIELAGGQSVEDFANLVRVSSLESVAGAVHDLEIEMQRLATERDQLNRRLGGIDTQLRQMNGGAEAAEAEEIRQQCLAQIRAEAEEYVRLKLASSVLHSAIERYREKIRGPVLTIASQLFRELTLGSFEALRVDEDNHTPVLVGIRSGGVEAVGVNGMSEGTCDQLYLALRLASLQMETAPRSELPLIVDDILVQFDDARAVAALRVLAKMGQQRQVIFFTHHEHLLQLAQAHLPGDFVSHRLGASLATQPGTSTPF